MPAEILVDYLSRTNEWKRIQFQIVFQCAPVLKGVKASNIITLPKGSWERLKGSFQSKEISGLLLSSSLKKEVILLYRKEWLENILEKVKVQEFFRDFGYEEMKLEKVLGKLQERYDAYSSARAGFPHELGVLLQYPLEDVKSFIVNEGRNSLLAGYWKVYHNPEEAEKVFRLYDRVKERAAREFMSNHNY